MNEDGSYAKEDLSSVPGTVKSHLSVKKPSATKIVRNKTFPYQIVPGGDSQLERQAELVR